MQFTNLFFLATSLQTFITAAPAVQQAGFELQDHINDLPLGWKQLGAAAGNSSLELQIAIKQRNINGLIDRLMQISDPDNKDFRRFMTKEQVAEFIKPEQANIKAISDWLASNGVKSESIQFTPSFDYAKVMISVAMAEKLLSTNFSLFNYQGSQEIIRTTKYFLPTNIAPLVDFIQPTTLFSFIIPQTTNDKTPSMAASSNQTAALPFDSSCLLKITPDCLRQLYRMKNYTSKPTTHIGVTGYLGQIANRNDLILFSKSFGGKEVGELAYQFEPVNSAKDDQGNPMPGGEANMDVQYAASLAYPSKTTFYSTPGSPPFNPKFNGEPNGNEPFLEWLNHLLAQSDSQLPQTITTSYGDHEQTVPQEYANRVCNDFAQLGVRGVSLLFSSGDGGVAGAQSTSCEMNGSKKFIPTFPSSCPFITSVGSTAGFPEHASSFSSGGFSDYFKRPSYQDEKVSAFIKTLGSTYSGLYNTTGRGFPDISAQGEGFQVIDGGSKIVMAGTSASVPTVAAIISNLNDYLLSQGKAPLGFLNPWLYKKASAALNDITSGSNPGCGTKGFSAAQGWDAVTGLGTPDFENLKALL